MPSQGQKTPSAQNVAVRARGIVTRMGRNPKGFGGEAIEPGPAGTSPDWFGLVLEVAVCAAFAASLFLAGLAVGTVRDLAAVVEASQAAEEGGAARGDAAGAQARGEADPHGNTGSTVVGGAQ